MGTYLSSITPPFREGERAEEEGCFESGVKGMKSQTIKIKESPISPKGKREVGVWWEQEGLGRRRRSLVGRE